MTHITQVKVIMPDTVEIKLDDGAILMIRPTLSVKKVSVSVQVIGLRVGIILIIIIIFLASWIVVTGFLTNDWKLCPYCGKQYPTALP